MSRPVHLLVIVLLALGALLVTRFVRTTRVERFVAEDGAREARAEPTSVAELRAPDSAEERAPEPNATRPARRRMPLEPPATTPVEIDAAPGELATVLVEVQLPPGVVVPYPRRWDGIRVTCSLRQETRPSGRYATRKVSNRTIASGDPAPDGTFAVERAPAGVELTLGVTNPFGPGWLGRIEPLLAGERREVRVELAPGMTVSGRVLDERGEPADHVSVSAAPLGDPGTSIAAPSASSDAAGFFRLERLARQSSRIRVTSSIASSEEAVVDGTGDVDGIVLHVVRGSRIEGRVTWPDGSPAKRCDVLAIGELGASALGNADGTFHLMPLPPGRYEVRADAERQGSFGHAVLADVPAGGPPLEIVLEETVSHELSGTVQSEEGVPVKNFWVEQTSAARSFALGSPGRGKRAGTFVLKDLPPGALEVVVHADGFQSGRQTAEVGANPPQTLHFVLRRSGLVRGRVLDARDQPVRGAEVVTGDRRNLQSGADGGFEFRPESPRPTLYARKAGHADSETLPLEVDTKTVEDVVLRLRQACRLRGRVLDPDGRPIRGARVRAFESWRFEVACDAQGSFVIDGLPPGEAPISAVLGEARAQAVVELDPRRESELELRLGGVEREPGD